MKDYVKQVKKYYIDNSGLTADWLSEREKLETIRKADTVARIVELFSLIKYPLFHLNSELKDLYIVEYIYSYVYHPKAIKITRNVVKIFNLMRDELGFDEVDLRRIFKNYTGSIISNELVNTKIELMAGIGTDDILYSANMRGKV